MSTLSPRTRASALLVLSLACGAGHAAAQGTDDTSATRPRLSLLPVVGSAPETGFQYGVTALRTYRLGSEATTRTSQQQVYAIYTTKSQARGWVQLDRWSAGNRWRVRARAEYQRFPLPYYGIGGDTPDEREEWYTSTGPTAQLLVQRRLGGDLFAGASARYTSVKVRDVETGGALVTGAVHGSAGGAVAQLQGFVSHDSRDHVLAPRAGHLLQLTVTGAGGAIGSRYDFTRYAVDARRYWAFGARQHVVAAQLLAEATTGRAPFDQLVQVGSDTAMRGYTRGRYRERDGINGQVEYRSPYWRRLGFTAFGGGGVVMRRLGDTSDATLLPTVGVGLRALLVPAQRATIRVDFGMGKGSTGLYVALNEAF
ncbi:MAG TPA: BamA/TamA family outer membrane protein [Gemmatimonadaceae bacterium]|nr:BamA/TamA family outer membrane protein [Gemmatimonadaceae bacterium]